MEQIVKTINPDTLNQHIDVTADSWRLDTTDDDLACTLAGPGGFLGETLVISKPIADNEAVVTPLNGLISGETSYTFTSPSSITIQSNGQFGSAGNWEIIATTNVAISPDLVIGPDQSITYSSDDYAGTGSFQPIAPDLNLDAAAGSSTDPKYIAAIMGNVLGAALSKTKTYIGALIGKYSITGTRGSTYPQAGVIGEVGDGVTTADGAFVAVLGGDSEQTLANAAYGVDNQNSTGGSGFAYGLDLSKAAHDGYPAMAYRTGDIRFSDQTVQSTSAGIVGARLLQSVAVNLNEGTAAKQAIYTCPTSRRAIPTMIVIQALSGNLTTAVFQIGWNASANDVVLSYDPGASGTVLATKAIVLNIQDAGGAINFMSPTPVIGVATNVLGLKVTTPEGSALTARVDFFGYLTNASNVPVAGV